MTAAESPAVAVDVVAFTLRAAALHVLLVQAQSGPFARRWMVPGGRVRPDESLDEAARRELRARTPAAGVHLEQLYTFGHPARDPRGRVVSVAYVALVADDAALADLSGDGKYAATAWEPVARVPPLAYDHGAVVAMAAARLRAKLQYTNLAYTLLPSAFTLSELQALYEAILGRRLDRRNFRRRFLSLGLVRPLRRVRRGAHRPAALYAFRSRRPTTIDVL